MKKPRRKKPSGSLIHRTTTPVIAQYDATGFVIDGVRVTGGMAIIPDRYATSNTSDTEAAEMYSIAQHTRPSIGGGDLAWFSGLVSHPHVVLLGVGAILTHPHYALRAELQRLGLTGEIVATAAACRTWNLLLAEGRSLGFLAIPPASEDTA